MSATSTNNVNSILNRVAVEVGLLPVGDPYASSEDHFVQMKYLIQTAGEELALAYPWSELKRSHSFVTDGSGEYPLPDDYLFLIPQTGWESANNRPLSGPLTAQEWTFNANYLDSPIRAMFRLQEGVMTLLGEGTGQTISYEYQTRNWVAKDSLPVEYADVVVAGSDIPLFNRTMFTRYLKVKWQDSKGFDSSKAQDDFNQMFEFMTAKDKSGKVLNAGGGGYGGRLLSGYNVPDTGYGI